MLGDAVGILVFMIFVFFFMFALWPRPDGWYATTHEDPPDYLTLGKEGHYQVSRQQMPTETPNTVSDISKSTEELTNVFTEIAQGETANIMDKVEDSGEV